MLELWADKRETARAGIQAWAPDPLTQIDTPLRTKTKNVKVAKCDFSQSQLYQVNPDSTQPNFRYYYCLSTCQTKNLHLPMSPLLPRGPQSYYREPNIEILCVCVPSFIRFLSNWISCLGNPMAMFQKIIMDYCVCQFKIFLFHQIGMALVFIENFFWNFNCIIIGVIEL